MKQIYEYENYREYLSDFFKEMKKKKKAFSLRYFAQKAGFVSHSYANYIMEGKRNASEKSVTKLIKGIGLVGKKADYFRTLVKYNQAKDNKQKDECFRDLSRIKKNTKAYKLNRDYYSYFDEWYYPIIRHIVSYFDWDGDYKKLSRMVDPKITEIQAKNAVDNLLKIGIIKKSGNIYSSVADYITSDGIPREYRRFERLNLLKRGIEAAELKDSKDRFVTYSTLSLSKDAYEESIKILEEAKKKIIQRAMKDEKIHKVYQMVLEIFQASIKMRGKK